MIRAKIFSVCQHRADQDNTSSIIFQEAVDSHFLRVHVTKPEGNCYHAQLSRITFGLVINFVRCQRF